MLIYFLDIDQYVTPWSGEGKGKVINGWGGGEVGGFVILASLKKQMGTYAKGRRVNHSLLMSFRKNIKIFILGVGFLFGVWKYSIHPQNKGESGVSPGVCEIFRYRQTHILIPCYFYLRINHCISQK